MRKKLITLLFAVSAGVGTMFASTKIGDLYYNLDTETKTAIVTRGGNYQELDTVLIPSSVVYAEKTYNVTSIDNYAFGSSTLSVLIIQNGVTSIGEYAFQYSSNLISVTLPNSITSIGKYAFEGCSALTSVWISDLSAWCAISFGMSKRASSNPLYYAHNLYLNEQLITDLVIPNDVTSIGDWAFVKCNMNSVSIPEGVTSIREGAFAYCSDLTSIEIPNSVTSIGEEAFEECTGLTSVTMGNSVAEIGGYAFYACSNLTSVIIPKIVTSIGEYAYYGCYALTSVEAPAIFFDIEEQNWINYTKSLQSVVVNAGELNETELLFLARSYKSLKKLDVSGVTNNEFADEAFNGYYNLESLMLPAALTRISFKMAAGCYNLQSIVIPANVTEIDQAAFEDCRSVTEVTFAGNALTKIGAWAFYNCHELANIDIPEGVTEIGKAAFYGCAYAQGAHLPASVKSLGDNAFALCSKMKKMEIDAVLPPAIEAKTFDEVSREMPVYVPDESVNLYKSHALWREMNIIGRSNAPQGINQVSNNQAQMVKKYIRDGQIFIRRGDKIYTLTGQEVSK